MKNIKNFKEAQELVKEIPIIRKELSDLGYNMSLKANLLADFTECYARDRFGLRLENGKGYDGIDREGKKYQVKYTIIEGTTKGGKEKFTHTLDHIRPNTFDFLIAVILDKNYEIKKVFKIPHNIVRRKDYLGKKESFRITKKEVIRKLDKYSVEIF